MTAQQAWLDPEEDEVVHEPVHVPGDGPHDVEDLDPEVTLAAGTVDFGAVRVPVPERGTVAVDPAEKGRLQAIHVSVPEGRLSVSALAAPKSSRLWPDLVKEIDASLREGGARVRSFQGDWGRELHATSGAATSLFVGVDGVRWMLYGVATGPTRDAGALDEQLRRMMRGTIVVRGRSPYPVRTVLPLEVPEHLVATQAPAVTPEPEASGSVVELRPSADGTPGTPPAAPASPTTALPAHRGPVADGAGSVDATTALPVPPRRTGGPVDGTPLWSDPVRRIAGPGGALPLDAGPDPDDRPTDVRPAPVAAPPTERWPVAGMPLAGGSETAPWALDQPPPPSPGGRRRLREPGEHLPVSPGLAGPWAPWPGSPTGSGRAVPRSDGARRAEGPPAGTPRDRTERPSDPYRTAGPAFPTADGPGTDDRPGRRRLADPGGAQPVPAPPRTVRHRGPDPAPAGAPAVPEVLRVGRHAAVEPRPDRHDRGTGCGAETQPWLAPRASRFDTAPGPAVETAPWAAVPPPGSGLVTEPIPVPHPAADRPTGRHHRPD